MIKTLLLLTLAQPAPVPAAHMNRAWRAALEDARANKELAPYFRYKYLPDYADTAEENEKTLAAKGKFHTAWNNWLSRHSQMGFAKRIAPNVWRLNYKDYCWRAEVWERLAGIDPWFHSKVLAVQVKEKTGEIVPEEPKKPTPPADAPRRRASFDGGNTWVNQVQVDGRWVEERKQAEQAPRAPPQDDKAKIEPARTVTGSAEWIDAAVYAELVSLCKTTVPVVRADWFLYQSGQQQARVAGYYDWLNLGQDLKDFDKLVGAHIDESRELLKAHRGIVGRSKGVTYNNRGMEGGSTVTEGVRILTEDYKRSTDIKHPLRLKLGDAPPDGGEALGTIPNGLVGQWVQNGLAKRLDAVPPDIAGDRTSHNPDFQVHPGLCMRCHREGFKPIDDWGRRIYTAPFSLDSPDYDLQIKLRAAHLSNLKAFIDKGNKTYAEALDKLGYTPRTWSEALEEEWSAYADLDVGLDTLARWWSVPPRFLKEKLAAEADRNKKKGLSLDPVFVGLLQGMPARIEWIEELNPEIYRILRAP